jgi:hypothetical protein
MITSKSEFITPIQPFERFDTLRRNFPPEPTIEICVSNGLTKDVAEYPPSALAVSNGLMSNLDGLAAPFLPNGASAAAAKKGSERWN